MLKYTDREAYIRFVFIAKKNLEYCKKGYEICFDQIKMDKNADCKQESMIEFE